MTTICIAVGSLRAPKLDGVKEAIAVVGSLLDSSAAFEIVGAGAPSGVGHTPASRAESMAGARNRSEGLYKLGRERNEPWNYFVGLEGGLDIVPEKGRIDMNGHRDRRIVLLESWAYVMNAS